MPGLDLYSPTLTRDFTYYDKCAIKLTPAEMVSTRVRITVAIIRTPLYRTLNLKYPLPKEFYGYGQWFSVNTLIGESAINYYRSIVWDYWNEHAVIAHQLTNVFQRLSKFVTASIDAQVFLLPQGSPSAQALSDMRPEQQRLTEGLTLEALGLPFNDGIPGNDFVNTFVHPFDLMRFAFVFGTVFSVKIESWSMGNTLAGVAPGNPETNPPYNQPNANDSPPSPSPGAGNPQQPYGLLPPLSSPIDPSLNPNDFSNAPTGIPQIATVRVQGWSIPAIPSVQGAAFAVGCARATFALSVPILAGVQNAVSLGTAIINVLPDGNLDVAQIVAAFPGFIPGTHFMEANAACGM